MDATTNKAPNQRKARKRGNHEGTLYRRDDGLWIGELMVGHRADGKRDVRKVSAKTQRECRARLDELKQKLSQNALPARGSSTVTNALDQWLEDCVSRGLRQSTLTSYRDVVARHIRPALGHHKLPDLRPEHVRSWLADLTQRDLSAATVRYARTLLHGALDLAVRMDLIGRNVADATKAPKYTRPELHPPSPADVALLLDTSAATGDRLDA